VRWLAVIVLTLVGLLEFLIRALLLLFSLFMMLDVSVLKPECWRIAEGIARAA
jgi:hypothetical protein